jgi:hypothetical protein
MKTLIVVMALLIATSVGAMIKYYCPKCQSTDIQIVCTDPPPKPEMVSMDEMGKGDSFVLKDSVMRWKNYKAMCLKCNYEVYFTRAY